MDAPKFTLRRQLCFWRVIPRDYGYDHLLELTWMSDSWIESVIWIFQLSNSSRFKREKGKKSFPFSIFMRSYPWNDTFTTLHPYLIFPLRDKVDTSFQKNKCYNVVDFWILRGTKYFPYTKNGCSDTPTGRAWIILKRGHTFDGHISLPTSTHSR